MELRNELGNDRQDQNERASTFGVCKQEAELVELELARQQLFLASVIGSSSINIKKFQRGAN